MRHIIRKSNSEVVEKIPYNTYKKGDKESTKKYNYLYIQKQCFFLAQNAFPKAFILQVLIYILPSQIVLPKKVLYSSLYHTTNFISSTVPSQPKIILFLVSVYYLSSPIKDRNHSDLVLSPVCSKVPGTMQYTNKYLLNKCKK